MKKTVATFAILLIAVIVLLFGCSKKQTPAPKFLKIGKVDVQKYRDFPTIVKAPSTTVNNARKSVLKFIKSYFQRAFLDIKLAKSRRYEKTILKFYSNESQARAAANLTFLSLGKEGKKLSAASTSDLQIPLIAIHYDKSQKPSLSTVQFTFKAKYRAQAKEVNLKTFGWLNLQKQNNDWRIFDFWTQQDLK